MSFVSKFKKCFEEGLSPYGFISLKGSNCFGKLINNELIYFITFQTRKAFHKGKKAFSIRSGVTTIYSLNLLNLENNGLDLINYKEVDPEVPKDCFLFEYDNKTIDFALETALKYTIDIAVKNLLRVCDLSSYIDFYKMMGINQFGHADEMFGDSILLILTNNHESFSDVYKHFIEQMVSVYDGDENNPVVLEYKEKIHNVIINDIINPRDKVFNSPELMRQVEKELEHRKSNNIRILQKYGLL